MGWKNIYGKKVKLQSWEIYISNSQFTKPKLFVLFVFELHTSHVPMPWIGHKLIEAWALLVTP